MANGGGSSHPHLRLEREQPVTERRPRQGFPPMEAPTDPAGHWMFLGARLQTARDTAATDLGGYDQRRLIKITLAQKVSPEDIARASSNIDVVSQEEGTLVLAFATEAQLEEFEAKLAQLAAGEYVTYVNLLFGRTPVESRVRRPRTQTLKAVMGAPDGARLHSSLGSAFVRSAGWHSRGHCGIMGAPAR